MVIKIVVSVGASHIIALASTFLCKFLELGKYYVITSFAVSGWTHVVMYFFSSIYAEYHVRHLSVGKFHDLIIQKHSVGREGKSELLVILLLKTSSVLNCLLHNIPVHKRLAAKEIHFKVPSKS